jgi:hypothetical protein
MPAFSHLTDRQLEEYLATEVVPHVSGREKHAAEFGPVLGPLLDAMLGLLAVQELHRLLTCEAQDLVESVFRSLIRKHAPDVEKQAVRYRAEVTKEAAVESARRGEQLRRETERLAAKEKARTEREAADAIKRHRDAVARNAEAQAELAAARARQDAAFVAAQGK